VSDSLEDLYRQIPVFQCLPGCTDCCGPVPFTEEEWENVPVKKTSETLTCPYATETGCEIYEHRPFMCRLFGTTQTLRCPHGCAPVAFLDPATAKALTAAYIKMCKRGPLPTHPSLQTQIHG